MALYKGDKRVTLATNTPSNVVPLEVTRDGVYTVPAGVNGFNPVTMKNTNAGVNYGPHCDENGIWHKPADWDDIESIDLTNKHEVYFLCACHLTGKDFFRIRFYGGGTLSWSYGHVSNGVYTIHQNSSETTVSSGDYISLFLSNITDDYVVVRIKATDYITSCMYQNWAATSDLNCAMPFRCQSVLMRYGRMVRGTSIQQSATYFLESDNIIDFASYYWNNTSQAIAVANAYEAAYSLQRWRCTGWDLSKNKVTSLAALFTNCMCLIDVPNPLDLSGWVTSYTTTIANMFGGCRCLNTNIIVRNWDLTNMTNMSNIFADCFEVKSITGTETWNSAPKCTNVATMFSNCRSVKNKLDVSKCYFGNGTANLTSAGSMFNNCYYCPEIDISNMNISKNTNTSYFIAGLNSCKKITMNNFTGISSACTNTNMLFQFAAIPELIIDGWDFSGISVATNFLGNCNGCYGLKKLIFRNCTAPSSTINDSSAASVYFRYNYILEYLDVSFVDMSIFSGTTTHQNSFRDIHCLVDFYPPKNISKSFVLTNDNNLSHDSLVRVIDNLKTVTSTQTLTIGTYNLSKLSDAEKAVATGKGWTLA